MCPQASPGWLLTAAQFVPAYLTGQPFNASASSSGSGSSTTLPPQDPRTTEDCLFLDVAVPEKIFNAKGTGTGAPVLVWIYGGGYTAGDKTNINTGPAAGLLERSMDDLIFVAFNYRLGAFGWQAGPTFQSNGTANAGLHDQRFALEWIQENIHLFGGDPEQVTVIGESAGGGSIMHQITVSYIYTIVSQNTFSPQSSRPTAARKDPSPLLAPFPNPQAGCLSRPPQFKNST